MKDRKIVSELAGKRIGIASELSDILVRQELLITFGEVLLNELDTSAGQARTRIEEVLAEDKKNLDVLEMVMMGFGLQASPKVSTEKYVMCAHEILEDKQIPALEKLGQYALLKHSQVLGGHLVHKSAQVSEPDIRTALSTFYAVHFENMNHERKLAEAVEVVGVHEIAGQDPEQGIIARMKDIVAFVRGAVSSTVTRAPEETSILSTLKRDHDKVRLLFREIEAAAPVEKQRELFLQLYLDLNSHAAAEEKAFYLHLRPESGLKETIESSFDEHGEMKELLAEMRALEPGDEQFREKLAILKDIVNVHVEKEENELFPRVREILDRPTLERLQVQFKQAKTQFQEDEVFIPPPHQEGRSGRSAEGQDRRSGRSAGGQDGAGEPTPLL